MKNPLEITFHDLRRNEKLEELIGEKFKKLQKLRPDITKCHVFFEKQSKHHQKANSTTVRLDIKVPRFEDIIVSENCSEDVPALKTTVIKVFKRCQDILLEKLKYHRDLTRAKRPAGNSLTAEVDVNDDEDVEV